MIICGVDEVGRGALAGPITAGAVILSEEHGIEGLKDSKKLTEKKRLSLNTKINKNAVATAVYHVTPKYIDNQGIQEANKRAIYKVVGCVLHNSNYKPELIIVDGNMKIPELNEIGIKYKMEEKADDKYESVAAASIIAKVSRDGKMFNLSNIYKEYGFRDNKGYGTKSHRESLKKHGACKIHRKSFNSVP